MPTTQTAKRTQDTTASQIAIVAGFAPFFAEELGAGHPSEISIEISYLEY